MTLGDLLRLASNEILAKILTEILYSYYIKVLESVSDVFGYKIKPLVTKDSLYYSFLGILYSEESTELQQGDTK